jgi:hypothetical protein
MGCEDVVEPRGDFLNSQKPWNGCSGILEDGLCQVIVLKEHGVSIDELEGEAEFDEGGVR